MIENKYYSWEEVESYLLSKINEQDYYSDINSDKESFSTIMPPPNVTGVLHMGHALVNTLQDTLTRYKRMKGFNTLWQPGVDHAGIATQVIVEKQLMEKGITRRELGRESFLQEVFKWKEHSQARIENQIKAMGNSCDFSYMAFTMDKNSSKAVTKVFVDLYKAGLIYQDNRLVNWDTKLQTAISDLEVENREIQGFYYYIKYYFVDSCEYIIIATTRPETMFGDTAIAVNPEDERYSNLIGKEVIIPISNRKIKIITDEYADKNKGSGAVKITPAHDFNDFEVGKRNNLEIINILNKDGTLNDLVPHDYQGLSVEVARKKLLIELENQGYLEKQEKNIINVPYGDRSSTVVQPFLTKQWFVNAKVLAKDAIKVVEEKKIEFIPKSWKNLYFDWMKNIQPWCISRQLWWGHQIPVYYAQDGKYFIAETKEEAVLEAKKFYGKGDITLVQDEDVLDTWFSSSLWPFVTLGWSENMEKIKKYYPTDVLITGFDIIFFWVARMIMMSMFFMKEIPFKKVYINALIRDEKGQKMSKSKGNVIDPLDMTKKYGTDALRFTLMHYSGQGRDISLSEKTIEGYRNFVTKIWNSFKFSDMNGFYFNPNYDAKKNTNDINKWILFRLQETQKLIDIHFDNYRFNEVAAVLYDFVWKDYCDCYLELVKPLLANNEDNIEIKETMGFVFDAMLKLLHSIMPFITQYLYENLHKDSKINLALIQIDNYDFSFKQSDTKGINDLLDLITKIRSIRSDLNITYSNQLELCLEVEELPEYILKNQDILKKIAKISEIKTGINIQQDCVKDVVNGLIIAIPLKGFVDTAKEIARLEKNREKLHTEISKIDSNLRNDIFLAKASKEIIKKFTLQKDEINAKLCSVDKLLSQIK